MANRGNRQGGDGGDLMQQLANAIANLGRGRDRFDAPRYSGESGIELFLQQFDDIHQANNWDNATALIKLRGCLEKAAAECGRGATVADIQANLRARFGLTQRQALDRLRTVSKEPGQSFHELGADIERLVRLAYPTMAAADQVSLSIETFRRALDNKGLARHWLAVPCNTMAAIIRATEEYFQVSGSVVTSRTRHHVATLGREDDDEPDAQSVNQTSVLKQLVQAVEQNTKLLAQLVERQTSDTPSWSAGNHQSRRQGNDSGSQ